MHRPSTLRSLPNKVWHMSGTYEAEQHPGGTVACIGVFDGVHRGHQALIGRARAEANRAGLPLVAVTFDPHPESVIRPGHAPRSLATVEHRIELLHAAGADSVEVLAFDETMAAETPEEFVQSVLADRLRARTVVVGENFLFGAHAAGNVAVLADLGRALGFEVIAMPLASDDAPWSSSRIRALLASGQVGEANEMLGREYSIDGTVVHGDHRGRELGYPTANLEAMGVPVVPADGVYAGWLRADGGRLPAAISVGTNPQFDGRDRRIETYVIDRADLDLYGCTVRVTFADRIRGQEVFDTLDVFIAQMGLDVERARILLAEG
jgi:riboflavin kinase/FMN adenylyltransferase